MLTTLLLFLCPSLTANEAPLHVFLRGGVKTHGPGQHEHEKWVGEWKKLLDQRGAVVEGALRFPTAEELARTDVLVLFAADGGSIHDDERKRLDDYLARGGGIVALHDAVCGDDPQWWKTVIGGAWENGHAKWHEGLVDLYFTDRDHPISKDISNFRFQDEIYTDLHMQPEARVLVRGFQSVFDASPQAWVYEKDKYRAFVAIQGHEWSSFYHPAWRTLVLRGIAWAGKRDAELLTTPAERAQLAYPPGGPLPPERAASALVVHPDFDLSLVAAEPLIVKPISIDWDAKGRLWVAETPGYPEKERFSGVPAHDEISILTDANGDGRMDTKKVFFHGLDLVTSLVFHQDGVIVTQAPEILFLRDTDGDDVADKREVLFRGFGFGDTHAVMSNMRWGPDGWIYATQGYSGGASRNIVNAAGHDFGPIGNGLFRFKPDGSAIEMVSSYGSNTWGCDFDDEGELFFSMANGAHLRHVVVPERVFEKGRFGEVESWADCPDHDKVVPLLTHTDPAYAQIDFVGGFTAASGCMLYTAGAWPKEWRNAAFVAEPTVHLVHHDVLAANGATFKATKEREPEFLAGKDLWFRPVHMRTGPDGAMYVCDFYNQAVVHNDTRGPEHGPTNAAKRPDRDHMHGRIWRVQHKAAVAPAPSKLADEWQSVRAKGFDAAAWSALAASADPAVRRTALRIASELRPESQVVRPRLTELLGDTDARVRLLTLVALGDVGPGDAALQTIVKSWPTLTDAWSRNAALRVLEYSAADIPDAVFVLGATHSAGDLAREIVRRRSKAGAASDCCLIVSRLAGREGQDPELTADLVDLVQTRAPSADDALNANDALVAIDGLLRRPEVPIYSAGIRLAVRWRMREKLQARILPRAQHLTSVLLDPKEPLGARIAALKTLIVLPDLREGAISAAKTLLDPSLPLDAALGLVEVLAAIDDPAAARALAAPYASLSAKVQERIFEKLYARKSWTAVLLDELEAGHVAARDLGSQKLYRLRNHPDAAIASRAEKLSAGSNASSAQIDELVKKFLPEVDQPGDAVNGKKVFTENCAACHTANGEGGKIGPELTGMGAHGARDLLPIVLDPNRTVEAGYTEWTLQTKDEQLFAGVLARESADSVLLRWNGGEKEIARSEIESLKNTGRSPMPTGLEKIGAAGLRDVIAYLSKGTEGFRVLDLELVASRNSLHGIYDHRHTNEILKAKRFGIVEAMGVPFELLDPARSASGNNVLVMKGGSAPDWDCKLTGPTRVEVPVGSVVNAVHVLGGIAAWGYPYHREKTEILKWTWKYADGTSEEVVLHNGVEFGDWIARNDVPGSEFVEGLLADDSWGQVRFHSLVPSKKLAVASIVLESYDNLFAPTIVAMTAELPGAKRVAPAKAPPRTPVALDVLVFGGGSSHDFAKWFGASDLATLSKASIEKTYYTEKVDELLPELAMTRVLVLSNNQPLEGAELRAAILAFVERGGALLLEHPATWYNWPDWPEYNRELVGGGARGHEEYREFDVKLGDARHPVLQGVPASFAITDELYQVVLDPSGANEVLATSRSKVTGKEHPCFWTRKHGQGRILCLTLGHDGAAHESASYQKLLQNGVRWLLAGTQAK